jgi:hypothetical protein
MIPNFFHFIPKIFLIHFFPSNLKAFKILSSPNFCAFKISPIRSKNFNDSKFYHKFPHFNNLTPPKNSKHSGFQNFCTRKFLPQRRKYFPSLRAILALIKYRSTPAKRENKLAQMMEHHGFVSDYEFAEIGR